MQHVAPTEERRPATGRRRDVRAKVYLVFQRQNLARDGKPNVTLISAHLTWGKAKEVRDNIPGTFVTKVVLTKNSYSITAVDSLTGE